MLLRQRVRDLHLQLNRCESDTDSIVWMREGVYGIVTMLFFDACTLEGKSFRVFYFYQKERFFL